MYAEKDLIFILPEVNPAEQFGQQLSRKVWVFCLQYELNVQTRDFLSKIMAAVQLNLERDVCLCDVGDQGTAISKALSAYPAEHILVFGLSPAQLGLRINAATYQAFNFMEANWIFAESLPVLSEDRAKKGLLWNAMKQIF